MVIGRHESVNTLAVFISYAPDDAAWGEKLRTHLAVLQRRGLIVNWSYEQVPPGSIRVSEIARHLNTAHIILLLMSPDYIASEQCYNVEMKRALERYAADQVLVIPILLSTIQGWDLLPVSDLQSLPASGKPIKGSSDPQKVLSEVASGIYGVVRNLLHEAQPDTRTDHRSLLALPPSSRPDAIVQRTELVEQLYTQLIQPDISALSLVGMGGIGKSTLAALLYDYTEQQRRAGHGPFTGETLWLKIDATVTLVDIIGSLREALGQSALSVANLSPERAALELARTLSAVAHPCLVILDQFETLLDPQTRQARVERPDVREWLDRLNQQSYTCRMLFTSRFSPRGTRPFPAQCLREYVVPFLTKDEGSQLLHTWGVQASQAELQLALQRCQGHALALALLGGLLKNDASVQLATFFNHPLYTRQRIATMAEELLNYIFMHQLEQEQRELLLAFSVYREAVPVEAALTIVEARSGVAIELQSLSAHQILLAQHLLHASGNLCYQLHTVVAEFAQQHFIENDVAANQRVLCATHAAAARYYQQMALLNTLPREQRRHLDDVHVLVEAIWQYCHAQQQQEAYALLVQEGLFLDLQRWGSNGVLLEIYQELLPAPHWQPVPEQAARIYNEIGEIYQVLGQHQKARHYFEQSLRGFRLLQQPEDIVNVLNYLGSIHRQQNQFEQALACYQEAKQLSDNASSQTPASSMTLNNLGYAHYAIGRQYGWKEEEKQQKSYKEALAYFQQALSQYRAIEYFAEEARILNNMGKVSHALGHIEKAFAYHQQALALARKSGDRWVEATALNDLAVLSKQQELTEITCEDYYKQAILIFQEVGARGNEQVALKNLGYWYMSQKRRHVALAFFVHARNIYNELYYPQQEDIPHWVIRELRLVLGEQGLQALQADMETHAEQLVEQTLHQSTFDPA